MKKSTKIILGVLSIIVLLFIIDFICIFFLGRPILAKKGGSPYQYSGFIYDTYYCPEYSSPKIKLNGSKFACAIASEELGKIIEIKDTTKDIKDFVCAEALEQFYEDEKYEYFFNCIKGKYMIVKYENGYQETVAKALEYQTITIKDLDTYGITYIRHEK